MLADGRPVQVLLVIGLVVCSDERNVEGDVWGVGSRYPGRRWAMGNGRAKATIVVNYLTFGCWKYRILNPQSTLVGGLTKTRGRR